MFEDIVTKWRFTPLRAYDETGRFIKTQDLESSLTGSLVHVYFELKHYAIRSKRTDNIASNTFSAISTQVKILERGSEKPRSPYKSLMLKGPSVLPRSPTKKKDQTNATNTFKTGHVLSSPQSILPANPSHLKQHATHSPTPRKQRGKKGRLKRKTKPRQPKTTASRLKRV